MRDDHLVLDLEPRLGLPGGIGDEVRRKENLLGNGIDWFECRDVVRATKAVDEAAEDDGMRVPRWIRR